MESFSLKQCVFTEPEGKVDEVTWEEAAGGLEGIFFPQTNQKKKSWNTGWMAQRVLTFIHSRYFKCLLTGKLCSSTAPVGIQKPLISFVSAQRQKRWLSVVLKVGRPLLNAHWGAQRALHNLFVWPLRSSLADWALWCLHLVCGGEPFCSWSYRTKTKFGVHRFYTKSGEMRCCSAMSQCETFSFLHSEIGSKGPIMWKLMHFMKKWTYFVLFFCVHWKAA